MVRAVLVLIVCCVAVPAHAGIIFTDVKALLRTDSSSRVTTVEILLNGLGNAATGILEYPPDPIEPDAHPAYPPDPVRWVSGIQPTPFRPVMTFSFDDTGDYLGVEPTPFDVWSLTSGMFYGTLDFSGVTDVELGSLRNITGVTLTRDNGDIVAVDPFDIVSVTEPAALWLAAGGLLATLRRRRPA